MNPTTLKTLQQLERALKQLEIATAIPLGSARLEIDGTIQRFEFTFELFWKTLKKILTDEFNIEAFGPRNVLQQAYSTKLINNEKIWLNMLADRNMTSHTYQQDLADQIYDNIKTYVPFLKEELRHLILDKANEQNS